MNNITLTHARAAFFEDDHWVVTGSDADGREYTLLDESNGIRLLAHHEAQLVVAKIDRARKRINAMFWSVRAPYGTNAWLIDGMEERQIEDERMGW